MATQTVTLEGGRTLAVERFGHPDGTPVLYFHGLPGSRLDLVSASPVFAAAGVAVVAVDRPGFGGSSPVRGRTLRDWTTDVESIADRLGLERFTVAGYSSGGKFALACAWALAARLDLAVVVAGTGPPEIPGFRASLDWGDRISLALSGRGRPLGLAYWGLARRMLSSHPERFVSEIEKGVSTADREVLSRPQTRAALVASLREAVRQGVVGVMDDYAIEARPWGFALEAIETPVHIWHGDQDGVVPLSHSQYIVRRIPDAELTVLEGAGHLLGGRLEPIVRAVAGVEG